VERSLTSSRTRRTQARRPPLWLDYPGATKAYEKRYGYY